MIEQLCGYIARIIIGSFIVFAIRTLAGKSACTEAIQLACTCFMTILVLQPMWNGEISVETLEKVIFETKMEIELAAREAEQEQTKTLMGALEQHLEELLSEQGVCCRIELTCNRNGEIEKVQYQCTDLQAAEVSEVLTNYTGLSGEEIIYIGEESMDAR